MPLFSTRSLGRYGAPLGLLLLPLAANAQVSLPILNAGFENPVQADNAFNFAIPDWIGLGEHGVWRPVAASFFSTPVPEGNQIGYINGTSISQTLVDVVEQGSYVLSAEVGRRNDGFVGDILIELLGGASVITSATLTVPEQTLGTFELLTTAPGVVGAGSPLLGQALTVRISRLTGSQVDFDDVRVEFTASGGGTAAPEPGTLGLLLIPGAAAIVVRRRRL